MSVRVKKNSGTADRERKHCEEPPAEDYVEMSVVQGINDTPKQDTSKGVVFECI